MPVGVVKTKHDEKLWKNAKEVVSRNTKKNEEEFKSNDWAKVTGLFKVMKNKSKKKEK